MTICCLAILSLESSIASNIPSNAFITKSDNSQLSEKDRSFLFFGKKKKNKSQSTESDITESKSDYENIVDVDSGAIITKGMFNVIKKEGDYYFEIPLSLMDQPMLVVNKFVRVPKELNEAGVNRGLSYANQMVSFELDAEAKKLLVRQRRPLPAVPSDHSISRSVDDNYISPIINSFKLSAYNPDSTAVVVKVNDIYDGSNSSFNDVFSDINLGTSPKSELSRIKSIKAFDNNIYAISELTTKVTEPTGSIYVTVEVGSTLLLLPSEPMARRYASPRVGYFTESTLQYADDQQRVNPSHYITRWRLEPKEEEREAYLSGKLVEPAKPIVFWIDNSTPTQWRPYIRKGIEDWNEAFELAGFKNAIQVKQIPDSAEFDMDDINYSVLTYAASAKSNAMGPSITDPRTGEILEADIMWWHNVIDIVHDWIIIQTGAVDERAQTLTLPDELIGDGMRFVACHEVGHSLGLRHNMMASAAIPTDSLRSPLFIENLGGTSSSIMDYARFNYVAQPEDGVKSLSPQIGPYDRLAIQYGYRWFSPEDNPEEDHDRLQELLTAYDTPMYKYSEAQDWREAMDPRALSEDLGDDAVKSAKYGIANLKRIVPNLVEWSTTGKPGQDYDETSRLFYSAISQWQLYIYHVMANIGGMYIENTTVGDGNKTFSFVEADRQREALKFIIDEAITNPQWLFDADLTDYTFLVSNTPVGRMENSPSYILNNMQSFVFWDLLSDNRLIRMYENEAKNGKKAFKGSELMDMLHKAVFAKTIAGTSPNVRERLVQKNFVDALLIAASESQGVKDGVKRSLAPDPAAMLLKPVTPYGCFGALGCSHQHDKHAYGEHAAGRRIVNFSGSLSNRISDAISLKRGELMRIRELLISRRASADTDARYHYEDLIMRINTALGLPQLRY